MRKQNSNKKIERELSNALTDLRILFVKLAEAFKILLHFIYKLLTPHMLLEHHK